MNFNLISLKNESILLLMSLVILSSSCNIESYRANSEPTPIHKNRETTKEEAIEIARKIVAIDYDVNNYEVTVYDKKTYWGIDFAPPKEIRRRSSRGAVVEIYKSNGALKSKYVSK